MCKMRGKYLVLVCYTHFKFKFIDYCMFIRRSMSEIIRLNVVTLRGPGRTEGVVMSWCSGGLRWVRCNTMVVDDWSRQLHPKYVVVEDYSHPGKHSHRYI